MLIEYVFAFVVPLALSLALTPVVLKLAVAVGAIDRPGGRKAHLTPTPRLGGVAVFVSFSVSLVLIALFAQGLTFPHWMTGTKGTLLFGSLGIILLLGIWDDLHELRPSQKFLVQLFLAILVSAAGFRITNITDPISFGKLNLGIFDFVATVIWIIGVTNAINLIDGLDGLASGTSAIALLTMFPIAVIQQDMGTALVAVVLAGAVLGFLRYNFNPARIFLGDSGSLFLGFMLAILSTQSSTKSTTAFSLLVSVLALGLPIMDTLLSMARRLLQSFLPAASNERSTRRSRIGAMFVPDRRHIHHQLLALGMSHRRTVLILYVVSCTLGLCAFAVTMVQNAQGAFVLLVVGLAIIVGIRQLRYQEIAVLRNGMLLSLFHLRLLNRNVFQVFLDIVFIVVSFGLSVIIDPVIHAGNHLTPETILMVSLVCFVQFMVYWLHGVYRFSLREFGIADVLLVTRATFLAVALSGAVLLMFPSHPTPPIRTFVLDFYFVMTLALGSRYSFRMLMHVFQRHSARGKTVLIYGADRSGARALQRLLETDSFNLRPAGFLDDRPSVEGKQLNGYPIFGGHWKLERLVKRMGVNEILLASNNIKPEVLKRLTHKAQALGLAIRRFQVYLEEITGDETDTAQREEEFVLARKAAGAESVALSIHRERS